MKRTTAKKERPATAKERKAVTFAGQSINLVMGDEWARFHCISIRAALAMLRFDDKELTKSMRAMVDGGIVNETLENLEHTRKHFEGIVDLLNTVEHRAFLVLERLGYGPDNPPPEGRPTERSTLRVVS